MHSKITMFAPFVSKSIKPKNGYYYIGGYASTNDIDYQGETVEQDGIDISYFKQQGYIDYEHQTDITIGAPVKSYIDNKGFYVESALFADSPYVQKIMHLAKEIRGLSINRHLGYSIEGTVLERNPDDPSIITHLLITGLAITKNPANVDAQWTAINKSMNAYHSRRTLKKTILSRPPTHNRNKCVTTGYGDSPQTQTGIAALRPQDLGRHLHNLSYGLANLDPIDRNRLLNKTLAYLNKHYQKDIYSQLLGMQIASGCSLGEATKAIKSIQNS